MKYLFIGITLILVILVSLLTSCDRQEIPPEQFIASLCPGETTEYVSQHIRVRVLDKNALTFDSALRTGYCYEIEYFPDKTSEAWSLHGYGGNTRFDDEPFWVGRGYKDADFEIERFSPKDYIEVRVAGEVQKFTLPCSPVQMYEVYINKSREERYDCYFMGETKSENNTYEELKGQACDEYRVYCK